MLPSSYSRLLATVVVLLGFLPASMSAQESSEYAIRSGDRITTQLFSAAGEEIGVIGGQRIVDREGRLFLPFVGSTEVAGLQENSLRDLLAERYGEFYDEPVVDVQVELRVNITGAVGSPGQYFLDPTATISDAMANAGGINAELAVVGTQLPADPERVRLLRDGEVRVLNLRPQEVANSVLQERIRSGDWFHVPFRARSRVRDEITFWGSIVSFAASIVGLIYLINN